MAALKPSRRNLIRSWSLPLVEVVFTTSLTDQSGWHPAPLEQTLSAVPFQRTSFPRTAEGSSWASSLHPQSLGTSWSRNCYVKSGLSTAAHLGSWAGSASTPETQLDSSYLLTTNSGQHSLLACQRPHSHCLAVLVLLRERQCLEAIKWYRINN